MNGAPGSPSGGRRPAAAAHALILAVVLAVVLALPLATAPAHAAEAASAKEMVGGLIDSLTHAPGTQKKSATGFSGTSSGRGAGQSRQSGPTAPTPPTVPVVKTLPTGQQPAGQPLPGSAFPAQPAGSAPANASPAGAALSSAPAARQNARPAAPQPRKPAGTVLSLEHDGRERRAVVLAPGQKAVKKGQRAPRLPLVIFLHGAGGSAAQAMRQTGLGGLAQRAGFIAVFPEGLAGPEGQESGGLQTWNAWMCCGYARDQRIDDVGYLAALINRLKADHPVDPRRIHLAGFSNGAMLASRFALERPGIIASLASVAGYLPCDAQTPQEPLPVLVIHGNRDQVARFGPTESHPRTGRYCEDYPAKAQVEFWVRGMDLPARPLQVQDGRKSRVRVERYGPARGGRAQVEFVIVKGGGHAWPGGASERYRYCDQPTPDPDATALLLDFFKRQARPGAPETAAKAETPRKAETRQKPGKKAAKGSSRG